MNVSQRLLALDVFRGMTIALMILVNTPGSWGHIYAPLRHAQWHGCTPTDLVFPFFLFIVGVAIYFSFSKFTEGHTAGLELKILKRTAIIFAIGLLLNLYPYFNFGSVRIMGVLQRIALAYGVGAFICLYVKRSRVLLAIAAGLLLLYWAVLYFGGTGDPYSLEGNLARVVDLTLLGTDHIYKGFGIPFDPEGLLATIPSVATVVLGYLGGALLKMEKENLAKIKKLVIYGTILVVLGLLWDLVFPINKPLWTSSYVLFTGGLAYLVLALMIFIIDYKGFKTWARPFVHFGMNPLFIFVLSGLYVKTISYLIKFSTPDPEVKVSAYAYMYQEWFMPLAGPLNGSLLFALAHIIVFWFICYLLYRSKIFIKI